MLIHGNLLLFQTTLFQNKLLDASNPSSIYVNTDTHSLGTDLTRQPSFFGSGAATFVDVNGKFQDIKPIKIP